MKNVILISQLAISLISPILLALFIGVKLDEWLGYDGIFSIILLILGVIAGFMNAYNIIMATNRDDKKKEDD